VSQHLLRKLHEQQAIASSKAALWQERAQAIYDGCHAKQRTLIDSARLGYKYLSVRCPRRAGKSYGMTALALWWGEMHPGSRILIISLTLKSTKENFWSGAPGGIFFQSSKYGLNLKYNNTDLVWNHENGSRGRLAGAETLADIERIRGAMAEADLAIVDECKSFAPELLTELIRDVLQPGLMTRDGIMVLGGTPGSIPVGTFFEATSETARTDSGRPTCIPVGVESGTAYSELSPEERDELWRLHTWTIEDNTGSRRQWVRALGDKRRMGWGDEHPTWRREYLGQWVTDATDLVYSWAGLRAAGEVDVTWDPQVTKANPAGLPEADGPWHYVLGIDLGYVDESAFVLCAYSESLKELRHVWDFKAAEMTLDDFLDEIFGAIEKFGRPDAIVADTAGGGSKILVETLNQRYGLGIEPAKKTDKNDWIELVNSDFAAGRIKIIPGSDLAHELAGLQWDLSRESKIILARTGKLREDPQCPNHLCDALLYLYKFSYHFWSQARTSPTEKGTEVWWAEYERQQLEKALARRRNNHRDPHRFLEWTKPHRDPAS
jgi:hypothetical protein